MKQCLRYNDYCGPSVDNRYPDPIVCTPTGGGADPEGDEAPGYPLSSATDVTHDPDPGYGHLIGQGHQRSLLSRTISYMKSRLS